MNEVLTSKQLAVRDMREALSAKSSLGTFGDEGLDTTVLELRKTVIVEEIEEFVFRSLDDGRILNGGRRVKRTIFSETTRI